MIDAHCHLNDSQFENQVESEINRAKSVGVTTMICNGYDLPSSEKALKIAETYEEVWATIGVHPEQARETKLPDPLLESRLLKLASHSKVVAIGESGLDSPDPAQIELFEWHIELTKQANLPLVIHCRNTFAEIYQRIGFQLRHSVPLRVQMHCWTGSWDWAKKFFDLGCYLSFGGVVTFKSSHELREVAKQVPADRLLIETDSPYISPEPVRGKPNFPANLIHIARLIAQTRNITLEELDKLTTANAYRLFSKLKLPSR